MDHEKPTVQPLPPPESGRDRQVLNPRRRVSTIASFKTYYWLTKPGIIYGNALTAAAGFLLASVNSGRFDLGLFLATLAGISLIIACGCVINNYIDRGIDAKMNRTKKRASVTGSINLKSAMIYAVMLGLMGFAILAILTNPLTVGLGTLGLFFYLVMYSVGKRRSVYGTVIGSVAGATPITAGYTAVVGRLDSGAIILFLILVFWQMPHFYAIAMYRFDDYKAAGLPVLPVRAGMYHTKLQILAYVTAFTAAASLLTIFGYTGYIFLLVMAIISSIWLWRGLQGFQAANDTQWGRKMFLTSLIVISILSVMIPLGAVLP